MKFTMFYMASFLDILVCLKALFQKSLDWDRKFHIKNGIVVIYEVTKTFNSQQREIREYMTTVNNSEVFTKKFDAICKELRDYKKKYDYDGKFSNFRNKAGAHYDKDFDTYIDNLIIIDNTDSMMAIREFGDFLDRLVHFWDEIITQLQSEM